MAASFLNLLLIVYYLNHFFFLLHVDDGIEAVSQDTSGNAVTSVCFLKMLNLEFITGTPDSYVMVIRDISEVCGGGKLLLVVCIPLL